MKKKNPAGGKRGSLNETAEGSGGGLNGRLTRLSTRLVAGRLDLVQACSAESFTHLGAAPCRREGDAPNSRISTPGLLAACATLPASGHAGHRTRPPKTRRGAV